MKITRAAFTKTCCAVVALSAAFAPVHAADKAGGDNADQLVEIVVTGSLIADPNHASSSPIISTTVEDIRETGSVTMESALNELPQFNASGNAANGGQGGGAHATLNLHGLGSNRNLVLMDGKRLPPADIYGDVDINLIPPSILSGVETITGGA